MTLRSVTSVADLGAALDSARRAAGRIALVPTMGALHEGHLALARQAKRHADLVVMSVFVNPLQFAPGEDFATYPRDPARDERLADSAGVDVLWTPAAEEIYPDEPQVTVAPGPVGAILEGAIRPTHFQGVLTVVLKLFALARPEVALFGRKDAQQAFLVRRMVKDLNVPVGIVIGPTVRDADGLALSSRNVYLDAAMRARALALPQALGAGVAAFRGGERRAGQVVAAGYRVLAGAEKDGLVTEYLNVVDGGTFLPSHAATSSSFLVGAVRVGTKRLIDNVILGEGLEADPRC